MATKFESAENRYRNDPQFCRLVDMMVVMYLDLQFTPSEMRDAAMLAALRAENITMRPRFFVLKDEA